MQVYGYLTMEYCILKVCSQCQTIVRRTWSIALYIDIYGLATNKCYEVTSMTFVSSGVPMLPHVGCYIYMFSSYKIKWNIACRFML